MPCDSNPSNPNIADPVQVMISKPQTPVMCGARASDMSEPQHNSHQQAVDNSVYFDTTQYGEAQTVCMAGHSKTSAEGQRHAMCLEGEPWHACINKTVTLTP